MTQSYEIRNELIRSLVKSLVGPRYDQDEVIHDDPRQRYLMGALGPAMTYTEPDSDADLVESDLADSSDEEGQAEKTSARPTIVPNSFGMTFSVARQSPHGEPVAHLEIEAEWGQYTTERYQDDDKTKTRWKRTPFNGKVQLPLVPRDLGEPLQLTSARHDIPEAVYLTAVVRQRATCWIVTLFLVNDQKKSRKAAASRFLFQARLRVTGPGATSVFLPHPFEDPRTNLDPIDNEELKDLDMRYRHQMEFAVGHGISVKHTWDPSEKTHAQILETNAMPHFEVPRTDAVALDKVLLDMKALAETDDLGAALRPLTQAYRAWIVKEFDRLARKVDGLERWQERGKAALQQCEDALARIEAGIALLESDDEAARCFRFANRAMYLQRIHTQWCEAKRTDPAARLSTYDTPANHTWRPFQIAFVLLNLPGLTDLSHPERSAERDAVADLLWFPTGGGKTEAYLGLAAYTLAMRRRQGRVGDRQGEDGVAVLMRYTLRLLTVQQYQRAAALVCACEVIRRDPKNLGLWGQTPFRIGLWVGAQSTPNATESAQEDLAQVRQGKDPGSSGGTAVQFDQCPWCGSTIDPGKHMKADTKILRRTFTYCGDYYGRCLFTEKKSPNEGLPVVCVDEEIYRLLPAIVIATVDKFAQLAWNGQTQMLFGQVNGYCPRHGYRSDETADEDSHQKSGAFPAVKTQSVGPLRPPDLIIQDELHLISGPLGTLVGLYETAIEKLASFTVEGQEVRPKLILSTATIRRAKEQVRQLFNHDVQVFPPQGLDAGDNFFALQKVPSAATPGRMYLGVCAPGRKIKNVMIRVYATLLALGQKYYDDFDEAADPYMTLVGYFNSRRELGGVRRMVDDAISAQARNEKANSWAVRYIDSLQSVTELTSRMSATEIPKVLNELSIPFSKAAQAKPKADAKLSGKTPSKRQRPYDILLATNMIQVGVDVPRLGLMVVARQPKSTAEYIQATSRVGRRAPGLVVTVLNWAHPRDLSHYERFNAYHASFYKYVEANSVTPFSARARDRALAAVLVALVRQLDCQLNANHAAAHFEPTHGNVTRAVQAILDRAEAIGGLDVRQVVARELDHLIDLWCRQANRSAGEATLAYRKTSAGGGAVKGLLAAPGADADPGCFRVQTSLRSVEPTIHLVHHGCLDLEGATGFQPMPLAEES